MSVIIPEIDEIVNFYSPERADSQRDRIRPEKIKAWGYGVPGIDDSRVILTLYGIPV